MAHYALLDEDNTVVAVIVGEKENSQRTDWENFYQNLYRQKCKRTSYNTMKNNHSQGKQPFRKNYAGVGFKYDEIRDAFIPPKPDEDTVSGSFWALDEDSGVWRLDSNFLGLNWHWDQETLSWVFS